MAPMVKNFAYSANQAQLERLAKRAQLGLNSHNQQSGFRSHVERGRFALSKSDDESGEEIAITCCKVLGQWVHVEYLWVDQTRRGEGLGKALMDAVEAQAHERSCIGLMLTTISFQAPEFYERLGFEVLATLDDYPENGYQRYCMAKRF
jgi:ribosomal protein S18 acetylase RimI-like enzyme